MWDSCTSVVPNTHTWEQQELHKTNKKEGGTKRDASIERSKAGKKWVLPTASHYLIKIQ